MNASAPVLLAIGIDIGGTRSKLGLVDLAAGLVLQLQVVPTETQDGGRFLAGLQAGVLQLQAQAEALGRPVQGIGIGVTGFVRAGGVVDTTHGFLAFMEDYPLTELLGGATGLACRADNDARVVALGEARYGAGRGFARVLVLTLGTGLGVALVDGGGFDSPLAHGHMAGHISVRSSDVACYCGRFGCLEALVSASGLVAAAERSGLQALSAQAVFEAAAQGDPRAASLVQTLVSDLHLGLANYTNLFAPDVIVLGGGLAKGLGPHLARLAEPLGQPPRQRYRCKLRLSSLDEQAGVLGAAALTNLALQVGSEDA